MNKTTLKDIDDDIYELRRKIHEYERSAVDAEKTLWIAHLQALSTLRLSYIK